MIIYINVVSVKKAYIYVDNCIVKDVTVCCVGVYVCSKCKYVVEHVFILTLKSTFM
jgi:hypothetical protein